MQEAELAKIYSYLSRATKMPLLKAIAILAGLAVMIARTRSLKALEPPLEVEALILLGLQYRRVHLDKRPNTLSQEHPANS